MQIGLASSSENISIDENAGNAQALELGSSWISVVYENGGNILSDSIEVGVGQNTIIQETVRTGTVNTTSSL